MPDKPSRSVFVPLLVVGMLILAALAFVLFVPFMTCGTCQGMGADSFISPAIDTPSPSPCPTCGYKGKVPLLNIWRREAEEGS